MKDLVMGRRLSEREGMVLARDRVVWCIDWSRWEGKMYRNLSIEEQKDVYIST